MQSIRKFFVILAMLMAVAMLGLSTGAQEATAQVRFLHVIPGVAGLDVYINDNLSAANLNFGESSGYIRTTAGELDVRVTLSGVTSALFEQTIVTAGDEAFTLIASSTDPLAFDVYRDDLNALDAGTSRFNVIHAVKGGPALDFQADGQTIITGLAYKDFLNTIDVPANAYSFTAFPTGGTAEEAVLPTTLIGLSGRTAQTLVIYGPATAPQALVLRAPVSVGGEVGFVRVAHAAEGAPNVDLFVNDALIVPNLAFGESTVHLPVDAGSLTASLRVAGGGDEIIALPLEVEAGNAITVAATGSLEDLTVEAYADDISGVTSRQAAVSVLNSIAGTTITVTQADGTALAEGLNVGDASEAVTVAPSRQNITLSVQAGTVNAEIVVPNVSLYGGNYYNLIALRTGETFSLRVLPTGLAQAVNSAPGAAEDIIVQVPPTPTATTPPLAQPTATPIGASAEATPAPIVVVTGPTASTFPTARVILDPGANIQLREFPSADARSLGLAPNGTVFVVNGRVGAPIDVITGEEIPLPDGTTFVDPVSLLTGNDDLNPLDTWLNVTLETPDGAVSAWVNTLYLDVRDPRGERQRLADLPSVPRNRAGTASGTVVTTPIPPENFARAVVFNLDAGVNLNIRRTPETGGEVLARVLSGTSMRLIGVGASGTWAFVEYEPAEGGTITGWAGTLYLRYEFRGKVQTVEELTAASLIQAVDEATLRGTISADAPSLAQPTADPLRGVNVAQVVGLNPGVSLNVRRTPSTSAEVLANLPLGARVQVFSRTNTLDWVEVEFDGVRGWVSTTFLIFSFNERTVQLADIPLSTDFGALPTALPTTTPTPTPSA
ncbi:MAG: DUF4397 domain-containing protein [Anaerolineae bacterium]|nr:DUF4397 domain-containing protein [Anaerolineae bacterium]